MNNDKLKVIRAEYEFLLEENQILNDLEIFVKNLEEEENVKKYIKALKILTSNQIMSDDDIVKKIFDDRVVCQLGGKIYVYYGSYKYDKRFSLINPNYHPDVNSADFLLYRDLINTDARVKIRPYNSDYFESENIVIKFNSRHLMENKYLELRKFYCILLLQGYSEEEILEFIYTDKDSFGICDISGINFEMIKSKRLVNGGK